MKKREREIVRPTFPKRAVVTAGMPYGNKELHFGHLGGVFIHADTYSRFLKDRIGKENVLFVSGTDCYGTPILTSYESKIKEGYSEDLESYVKEYHDKQKEILEQYHIGLDFYGGSAIGESKKIHEKLSIEIFQKLYEKGLLEKRETLQFYDPKLKVYLTGRQVKGKCPVAGCQSSFGYGDECSLGHMYGPQELIDPICVSTGVKPELRKVENWYFKLPCFKEELKSYVEVLKEDGARNYMIRAVEEFLVDIAIHVQKKHLMDEELYDSIISNLPRHEVINLDNKKSLTFVFDSLEEREEAVRVLEEYRVRYRTSKTLVPFRLSGHCPWGIDIPVLEDVSDRTFWVWPESLWAPVSFTKTYLSQHEKEEEWQKWWIGDKKESRVYQFIGEDNIYFYCLPQTAMMGALISEGDINYPLIIPNNHVLFLDEKASSSGAVKAPTAKELLEHYDPEVLRMHFLSLGLAKKSVNFMPKAYLPDTEGKDPVLKDYNLLANVFNRLLRSCFYTCQKLFEGKLPKGQPTSDVMSWSKECILRYEQLMANQEFHRVVYVLDEMIRKLNKDYVKGMKGKELDNPLHLEGITQILIDGFQGIRVVTTLLHPLVPKSSEAVREYLQIDERLWQWEYIFKPLNYFIPVDQEHIFKHLPPQTDFFLKPLG